MGLLTTRLILSLVFLFSFSIPLSFPHKAVAHTVKPVKIGVLAFRSPEQTVKRWQPTAKLLSARIDGYQFEIIPMDYPQVNQAVANRQIDFILTNTGHYVELEAAHGIARIATLVKSWHDIPVKVFGGVIFTRSDQKDINTITDLRGKTFLAVGESSLGGFLATWEQLKLHGIDPYRDLAQLKFNGMPHDEVISKVLNGEADAGTVRTSIIEQLVDEGKITLDQVKIIHQQVTEAFPYLHSTELYPEWPFSRLPHTSDDLAKEVSLALLDIHQNETTTQAGNHERWVPPLDYRKVHNLMQYLAIAPYANSHQFTLFDVLKKYIKTISVILLGALFVTISLIKISRLNKELEKAKTTLENVFNSTIPICITSRDYEILMVNDAYKKIYPHENPDNTPMHCYESRPGPSCDTAACPLKRVMGGEETVLCEPVKIAADGSKQFFLITARPFRDATGKMIGIVECFQDITARKNAELERDQLLEDLRHALSKVKTLSGFLPICSSCKKIRDDSGYWNQIESYIKAHSDADFSHSICPACAQKLYPEIADKLTEEATFSNDPRQSDSPKEPTRKNSA